MDRNELFNYIELGRLYGVRVDVRLTPEYPGYIRVVGFHRYNEVIIEFYALGTEEEAAIELVGKYASLEQAINSIENYLGMPIEKWTNFNKTGEFPSELENQDLVSQITKSHRKLVADIISQRIKLPLEVPFVSKHEIWNSIEEYDEFMKHHS
jgi:hypothetical protein